MITLLFVLSLNAFAFEPVEIDYRFADKHVVHVIEGKTLKIISGKAVVSRKLDDDDLKWIDEKITLLKSKATKECGEEATIEVKAKGRAAFTVCGDQKDAKDFLGALAIK